MKKLTEGQKDTLLAITDYIKKKKYPPTIADVAEVLGIPHGTAYSRMLGIEKKGYIKMEGGARQITVLRKDNK